MIIFRAFWSTRALARLTAFSQAVTVSLLSVERDDIAENLTGFDVWIVYLYWEGTCWFCPLLYITIFV